MHFFLPTTAFSSRLGYEEHIPGQTRDWNEELQTTRELPKGVLPERLIRERAIFKVGIISVYVRWCQMMSEGVISECVRLYQCVRVYQSVSVYSGVSECVQYIRVCRNVSKCVPSIRVCQRIWVCHSVA